MLTVGICKIMSRTRDMKSLPRQWKWHLRILLHNSAGYENGTSTPPISLKFDPTSPKPCINHVQTNFQPQTSVNQNGGIQNPWIWWVFQGLKSEF